MIPGKNWRVLAASALCAVLIGSWGLRVPAAGAVEVAAERIAGFHPKGSVAVEQAVELIRHGDYSLALLRMSSETKDTSMPKQARILSAYALLVAGNTLGAFPAAGRA